MVEIKVLGSNDARTLEGGVVVGFASGVTYLHPDKPIELWINEVGVAKSHQGQGISKSVMRCSSRVEVWAAASPGC
jgi:hypothetical protein